MMITDPRINSLAAIAILHLLVMGIVLKSRGFRERGARYLVSTIWVFLLLSLGQIISRLGWFASLPEDALARVPLYASLIQALLIVQLTRVFLQLEQSGRRWWIPRVCGMVAVIALHENLPALPEALWINNRLGILRQGLSFSTLVLCWGLFTIESMIVTARAYDRIRQPLHRNRIRYWILTLSLAIASAVLFFARRDAWGSGFGLLSTLGAAVALFTHHLPDTGQMARRTVSYLTITLLGVVIYAAGFWAVHDTLQAAPNYSPLVIGAVVALILAVAVPPLLRWAQRLADRIITRTIHDPSQMLREYSESISNILDLRLLAMVVEGHIGEAMKAQHSALFVVRHEERNGKEAGAKGDGGRFHLRAVIGQREEKPSVVMSGESPVARYLRIERRPLTQYDIDLLPRFREVAAPERAWMASLGIDVFVPIYAKDDWIGLITLGPKISGDRYFSDDLGLLSTLADQTAVALENARLFDDLKIQNTENERLNEELSAANRELASLDQAKSDFINIASHELRTPLSLVVGYSEILNEVIEDGLRSPDSAAHLTEGVHEAVQRLEEIVDTLFIVSQLDTDTLVLHTSEIPVVQIIQAVASKWAEALDERRQTLIIESLVQLPAVVADGRRLGQVFSQLIQNAIKFTPDGGRIRITGRISGREPSPEGRNVEIIVADTGIGIATDDLERVFDKFYRVGDIRLHSTGETKFKGAGPGLGLTIARGIVEAHGGRIWVESLGHDEDACPGSLFHVALPV